MRSLYHQRAAAASSMAPTGQRTLGCSARRKEVRSHCQLGNLLAAASAASHSMVTLQAWSAYTAANIVYILLSSTVLQQMHCASCAFAPLASRCMFCALAWACTAAESPLPAHAPSALLYHMMRCCMHHVHAQIQGRVHPGVITAGLCACCYLSAGCQGALWRTFCTAEQQRLVSVLLRRSCDATEA